MIYLQKEEDRITLAKIEALRTLFTLYQTCGANGMLSLKHITDRYKLNPGDFGRLLVKDGLVRKQIFSTKDFHATISIKGIEIVQPDYLPGHTSTIIRILGNKNEPTGIMEMLGLNPKAYRLACDLADYFRKKKKIIELPIYKIDDVLIKLNRNGLEAFQETKPFFYHLK